MDTDRSNALARVGSAWLARQRDGPMHRTANPILVLALAGPAPGATARPPAMVATQATPVAAPTYAVANLGTLGGGWSHA